MKSVVNVRSGVSEEMDQQLLVNWILRTFGEDVAECFHHSPNGGLRDKRTASRLKMMGTRRGVPDLMCFCGRDGYVGLALELKLAGGRVSKDQQRWIDRLAAHGWMTSVAYGLDDAQRIVSEYLHS